MSDTPQPPQFPETERGALLEAQSTGGLAAAQLLIEGYPTLRERMQLSALLTRVASQELRPRIPFGRPEASRGTKWLTLDELAAIYQAAFDRADQGMAEAGGDQAEVDWFKAQANVLSFNFCADLAPCWPDDNELREVRHYAAGVEAARRAVRWRIELNKKAENFALAYWVLGVHQLGMGALADAVESLKLAVEHSRVAAGEYCRQAEVSGEGDWSFILNSGYLGIARALLNEPDGMAQYRAALEAFRVMSEAHPDLAADARFGSAQLEKTAQLFGAERRP